MHSFKKKKLQQTKDYCVKVKGGRSFLMSYYHFTVMQNIEQLSRQVSGFFFPKSIFKRD